MSDTREGQRVPRHTFRLREGGHWRERSTDDLFGGRTVVVFSLPGAFTPTCSSAHVPRYEELYEALVAHGVDEVACVSVNDAFVMQAWQREEGARRITFLPDADGAFTEAMGMLIDKGPLGRRSRRYAMLVRDGVVEKMFVEADVPGDPYEVSDADTMLRYLGGQAPPDIVLFTRSGCEHCERARRALRDAGLSWSELSTSPRILRALPGGGSTPQVFADGVHVGGADELERWLAGRAGQGAQG